MRFKLISSILLSASMVAAPVAASAAGSASKLSVVGARAGASTSGGNELGEGAGGIVALALLAGIAAILIVGELAGDDNDSVSA